VEDILGGASHSGAASAGEIEEIRILTVQVVGGTEFEKLKAIADTYSGQVRISLDSPLLAGPKIDFVADMLVEEAASFKEEAIVYVGHGTHGRDPRGPAAYRKLQELIRDRGNGNAFIGELQTGIEPVIRELSEKAFRRIRLCSLMMVSGHHWFEDVAGENDGSWKNVLTRAGYTLFRSAVNSFVSPRRCSYRLFITCICSIIAVVKQPIREYNKSIQRLDRRCTK
jgi:sirohydrochlorin cobaltochelatase